MKQRAKDKEPDSILGKLNHAALLIPLGRYFLNRTQYTESLVKKFVPQKLPFRTVNGLELFKDLLSMMSNKGAEIQDITYSTPNIHLNLIIQKMGKCDKY